MNFSYRLVDGSLFYIEWGDITSTDCYSSSYTATTNTVVKTHRISTQSNYPSFCYHKETLLIPLGKRHKGVLCLNTNFSYQFAFQLPKLPKFEPPLLKLEVYREPVSHRLSVERYHRSSKRRFQKNENNAI